MTSYNEETKNKYFLKEFLFDLGRNEEFENSLIFKSFVEEDQDDQDDILSEDYIRGWNRFYFQEPVLITFTKSEPV